PTVWPTCPAEIDADLGARTGVINTATVDGPNDDVPSNNENDDPVDVVTTADMRITKDVEDGPWIAGTEARYTVTVNNDGPSAADDARVMDAAPTGLTLTSIGATGGITHGWNCPSELGSGAPSAACEFDGRFPAGGSTTF